MMICLLFIVTLSLAVLSAAGPNRKRTMIGRQKVEQERD